MADNIDEKELHAKMLSGKIAYSRDYYKFLNEHVEELYKHKLIDKQGYEIAKNDIKMDEAAANKAINEKLARVEMVKDKSVVHIQAVPGESQGKKPTVDLILNDISSLDKDALAFLEKKYNINSIVLNRYYFSNKGDLGDSQFVYNKEVYKKLLNEIEEKYGDLRNNNKLSDLEKATIVAQRMTKDLQYNDDATKVPVENLNEKENVGNVSRTMKGALIDKNAICAGYSDLYRNVMSYIGIDSKEIVGYYDKDDYIRKRIMRTFKAAKVAVKEHPEVISKALSSFRMDALHNWNQVKIGGKWYNIDLTAIQADRSIVENFGKHPYLFTSDKDFNDTRNSFDKREYFGYEGNPERADSSISNVEIDKAIKRAKEYEGLNNLRVHSNKEKNDFRFKLSGDGKYQKAQEEYLKNNQLRENEKAENTKENDDIERD